MNKTATTQEELERHLLNNPMFTVEYGNRVEQSLLLFVERPLMRLELILDISLYMLESLSDQIHEAKPAFGVEEK